MFGAKNKVREQADGNQRLPLSATCWEPADRNHARWAR